MKQNLTKANMLNMRFILKIAVFVVVFCLYSNASYAQWVEKLKGDTFDCWTCEMIASTVNIMGNVAFRLGETLFSASYKLLGVSLALWLLFKTLNFINPFAPMDLATYLNEISARLFAAVFIAGFFGAFGALSTPNDMYKITVGNIFAFSQELAIKAMYSDIGTVPPRINDIADRVVPGAGITGTGGVNGINGFKYDSDNIFELEELKNTVRFFASIILRLSQSFYDAMLVMTRSFANTEGKVNFTGVLCGILIIFPYMMIMFQAHLAVVDAFMRICVIASLFPLFFVAWVFPYTRDKYTNHAFQGLLNACVILILTGAFIGLLAGIISANLPASMSAMIDPNTLEPTATVPDGAAVEEQIGTPASANFLVALFIPWLMLFSFELISSWADRFASNFGKGAASLLGGALLASASRRVMPAGSKKQPVPSESYDPLSNAKDAEGDGVQGDVHERNT